MFLRLKLVYPGTFVLEARRGEVAFHGSGAEAERIRDELMSSLIAS